MQDLNQTIQSYGAAWQEEDSTKRFALLEQCFSETGRYVDPTAEVSGRNNLCTHIGTILQSTKGRVEITSEAMAHHDVVHFTWHMIGTDGSVMIAGHDFIHLDADGKIAQLSGFFGDPTPLV